MTYEKIDEFTIKEVKTQEITYNKQNLLQEKVSLQASLDAVDAKLAAFD